MGQGTLESGNEFKWIKAITEWTEVVEMENKNKGQKF